MVGAPITAMVIIAVTGLTSFETIENDTNNINIIQSEYRTILEADRDAYQAQSAISSAIKANTIEQFSNARKSSNENMTQTFERIEGPSKNFTPNMADELSGFNRNYGAWKQNLTSILATSNQVLEANNKRNKNSILALQAFGEMRHIIDILGEKIEEKLADKSLDTQQRRSLEIALSKTLNADRDAYQAYVAQILITSAKTKDDAKKYKSSFDENSKQTSDRVLLGIQLLGEENSQMESDFNNKFKTWFDMSHQVVELTIQNMDKNKKIELDSNKSQLAFAAMRHNIDRLGEMQSTRVNTLLKDLNSLISTTEILYITIALAFIVISIIITISISLGISNVTKKTSKFMQQIAEGEFNSSLLINRKDEFGQMAKAINNMKSKLRNVVQNVQSASANVATGCNELSKASQEVSSGASEQAASVEETSATLEQSETSIQESLQSCQNAGEVAKKASNMAENGGKAVRQTEETMATIADKIGVIEDIAYQTNLLALNAAIEAARAGEKGKGFAVVASEVRKLAARSETAASEISQISKDSVVIAQSARSQIDEIISMVHETAKFVQEITAASEEQTTGIGQISEAMTQLDRVTQSNAALAEELASTSEQINAQAELLKNEMQFFKLD